MAIFLWLPCFNSYAVANMQFASEWGHIHHLWLQIALFERVTAVYCPQRPLQPPHTHLVHSGGVYEHDAKMAKQTDFHVMFAPYSHAWPTSVAYSYTPPECTR